MRYRSKKRRSRELAAKPVRDALIASAGCCEICGASPRHPHRNRPRELSRLCCHEIANGPLRQKALDQPYALLVLCWYCNGFEVTDKSRWPEAKQLGLLKRKRPGDYDLVAYNQLVNERAPDRIREEDVKQWR